MPPLTNADKIKAWRDKKRAKELCTYCGRNPVYKRIIDGFLKIYSKCRICLKANAWFQAEYREKLNNGTNSGSITNARKHQTHS